MYFRLLGRRSLCSLSVFVCAWLCACVCLGLCVYVCVSVYISVQHAAHADDTLTSWEPMPVAGQHWGGRGKSREKAGRGRGVVVGGRAAVFPFHMAVRFPRMPRASQVADGWTRPQWASSSASPPASTPGPVQCAPALSPHTHTHAVRLGDNLKSLYALDWSCSCNSNWRRSRAGEELGRRRGPSIELTQFHSNDNLNKQSTRKQNKQGKQQRLKKETFSTCFPSLVVWKYLFSINYFRLSREARRRFLLET